MEMTRQCYECDNGPCRCNGDPVLGPEWIKIKDCLPEKHQYVLLLADRYWNTPDGVPDMKVTASGYLAEHGTFYWSVFGERGFDINAFTHWMPIPAVRRERDDAAFFGDRHGEYER